MYQDDDGKRLYTLLLNLVLDLLVSSVSPQEEQKSQRGERSPLLSMDESALSHSLSSVA